MASKTAVYIYFIVAAVVGALLLVYGLESDAPKAKPYIVFGIGLLIATGLFVFGWFTQRRKNRR
jgi:hypothetical protein